MRNLIWWSSLVLCLGAGRGRCADGPTEPGRPPGALPAKSAEVGLPTGGETINRLPLAPAARSFADGGGPKKAFGFSPFDRAEPPLALGPKTAVPPRGVGEGRTAAVVRRADATRIEPDARVNRLSGQLSKPPRRPGEEVVRPLSDRGQLDTPGREDVAIPPGVTRAERDLLEGVKTRLLAVAPRVNGMEWPPAFEIVEKDDVNAYASAESKGEGKEAKVFPRVVVTSGMMRRVIQPRGDRDPETAADRLAFVLGHELGHILLKHVITRTPGKTPLLQTAFSREDELAADLEGMKLALKAGYSSRDALTLVQRMTDLKLGYSSFEGLRVDHPSWNDRRSVLDRQQGELWRAMSAFDTGVVFLLFEQYASAERCFLRVTREFPRCHEAWANLGHARLMMYCDGLEADDLRAFGVGPIVVGAFYTRPRSLQATRGIDARLWEDAVRDLRKALDLKPDLVLARANLGVAYLVRPAGKDVRQAATYLREAADQAARDRALDPLTRGALFVNLGVAELAGGRPEESAGSFDRGEQLGREFAGAPGKLPAALALSGALLYNRALLLADSPRKEEQRTAVRHLEKYLRTASPACAWWPLAYERYARLCGALGQAAKPERELADPARAGRRLVTSVQLGEGVTLTLTDPLGEVEGRLGPGQKVPVAANTTLVRLRYPAHGVEVLAADQVLAIFVRGAKAPALPLRGKGLGERPVELRVGMTRQDFERALEGEDYDFRELLAPDVFYRYYPDIGLAVKFEKGRVGELVVAQVPRQVALRR
jgi:tetratricopeptide (TPR) repeat protein